MPHKFHITAIHEFEECSRILTPLRPLIRVLIDSELHILTAAIYRFSVFLLLFTIFYHNRILQWYLLWWPILQGSHRIVHIEQVSRLGLTWIESHTTIVINALLATHLTTAGTPLLWDEMSHGSVFHYWRWPKLLRLGRDASPVVCCSWHVRVPSLFILHLYSNYIFNSM